VGKKVSAPSAAACIVVAVDVVDGDDDKDVGVSVAASDVVVVVAAAGDVHRGYKYDAAGPRTGSTKIYRRPRLRCATPSRINVFLAM